MTAAEHLERHLGKMVRRWSDPILPGIQVCLFVSNPNKGIDTLATLGLGSTALEMNGRRVRQEFLMSVRNDRPAEDFAKLLLHVAERCAWERRAILRGAVVELGDRVSEESEARALYASMPVAYPESLATLEDTSPPTVFVWLQRASVV